MRLLRFLLTKYCCQVANLFHFRTNWTVKHQRVVFCCFQSFSWLCRTFEKSLDKYKTTSLRWANFSGGFFSFRLMFWRLLAIAVMFMYKRLCEIKFCIFLIFISFSLSQLNLLRKENLPVASTILNIFEVEVDRVQGHIGFESYPDREIDGCVFGTAGFHQWCYYANFLPLSSVVQISIARARQPGRDICNCFAVPTSSAWFKRMHGRSITSHRLTAR